MSYDIAKIDIFFTKTKHMGKSSGGVNGYSGAGAAAVGVNSNGKRITAAQAKAIKSSVVRCDLLLNLYL